MCVSVGVGMSVSMSVCAEMYSGTELVLVCVHVCVCELLCLIGGWGSVGLEVASGSAR